MDKLDKLRSELGGDTCRLTEEMLRDIVEGSRAALGDKLLSVVLYGSYARGDYDEESDVDIALIVENVLTRDEDKRMIHCFSELCLTHDMVFSPNDIVKQKFDNWKGVLPYYKNIEKEGIVLWKTQAA